jgi:C-terminal processing protease CtpA/Prc
VLKRGDTIAIGTPIFTPIPDRMLRHALRATGSGSQAEHTGLFFEAAAGTKIVGSTTAGADGGITAVVLPGGLSVQLTGVGVRHADGRQLQRVGLPIDVVVKPTLKGIQAGRDEVLERALAIARAATANRP